MISSQTIGLVGLLDFLNDSFSKPDQSIWKGKLWEEVYLNIAVRHERAKILQIKKRLTKWVLVLIPLKARENHRASAKKKKKKPQRVNQSRRVVQSSRGCMGCEGGRFTFSRLRENTKPRRKKREKH